MSISNKIKELHDTIPPGVTLVAVSKTYPPEAIAEAYDAGQRIFGESRPQELAQKQQVLPADIEWHMIGHLQTNKVKYIAPFVSLIHSADSEKLLETISKEAVKNGRMIDVLLEIHIALEQSKEGWDRDELLSYLAKGGHKALPGVRFRGVMGIATYTSDTEAVRAEFLYLKGLFDTLKCGFFDQDFDTVSMGMSGDYMDAIDCGSNMVRIGSYIFGSRYYG